MPITKVTAAVLEPTAVTDNILTGSISSDKIADDAIVTDKIADGAVAAAKIADDAIATDKIADNAVSYDKLGARFTEKQDIATTSGTINLDASLYSIFELTSALTGATTLNIQNIKKGQVIDILVTGAQTITMADDFTTSAINQAGSGVYDGTLSNHIQVVCIDDNDAAAILIYSVATYTSKTDPS